MPVPVPAPDPQVIASKAARRGRSRVTTPENPKRRTRLAGSSPATPSATPAKSRQVDPFKWLYREGLAVAPPYSYGALVRLYDASDVLYAAIAAMETNVAGFGVQFIPLGGKIAEEHEDDAAREKRRIETWFRYCSDGSFTELRRRTRLDLELFGDGYWEMLRDARGKLAGMQHARSFTLRKGPQDTRQILADRWIRDEDGDLVRAPRWRRFRKYVQWINGELVWFKEWGDPRRIRWDNGREDPTASDDDCATEILNFMLYAPDHVYGKPRWRGAACDVKGRTAAAEINADTFDNKGVPPLLIMVQGALLAKGGVERIQEHFSSLKGRENWHAPLVIEAEPGNASPTGDGPLPQVRITAQELSGAQTKDALFSTYRQEAADNIGAAFRLPPIYLGRNKDMNRATAEASKMVAEEQAIGPERSADDEMLNREVLPELGVRYWELKSNAPPLLSEEALVKLLEVGIKAGTLTPEDVAKVLEPMLGLDLHRPETWARIPAVLLDAMIKAGWVVDGLDGTPPAPQVPTTPPAGGGAPPPTGETPTDTTGPATASPDATEGEAVPPSDDASRARQPVTAPG